MSLTRLPQSHASKRSLRCGVYTCTLGTRALTFVVERRRGRAGSTLAVGCAHAALADDQRAPGHASHGRSRGLGQSRRGRRTVVARRLPRPWRTSRLVTIWRCISAVRAACSHCSTRFDERVSLREILTVSALTSSHPCLEAVCSALDHTASQSTALPSPSKLVASARRQTTHCAFISSPHLTRALLASRDVRKRSPFMVVIGSSPCDLRSAEMGRGSGDLVAHHRGS